MHRFLTTFFITLVISLVLAGCGEEKPITVIEETEVTSFEECAEAGYAVMESYPRQCRTPDGKVFVEEINEPVKVKEKPVSIQKEPTIEYIKILPELERDQLNKFTIEEDDVICYVLSGQVNDITCVRK